MLTTIPVPYSIGINKPKKGTSYFSPIRVDDVGDNNNTGFSGSGSAAASPGVHGNSHSHNGNGNNNSEGGRLVGEYEQHPLRQQTSYLPISAVGGAQFVLKPPRMPKPKAVKVLNAAPAAPAAAGGGGQQGDKGKERERENASGRESDAGVVNVNGSGENVPPVSTSALAPTSVPVPASGTEPELIDESGPAAASNREMTVERRLDEMVLVKEEDELDGLRALNGAGASEGGMETRSGSEIVANGDVDSDGDVVMMGEASAHKDKSRQRPVEREAGESTIISLLSSSPPTGSTNPTTSTRLPSNNASAAPARPSQKIKKYGCDICGKIFTRGRDVKRHKESRHWNGTGRNNNEVGGGGTGEKGVRQIGSGCRCPYCNRVLTRWVWLFFNLGYC